MIAASPIQEINQSLSQWLMRLRFRDAVVWSVRGLIGGLAVGLGIALAARLQPLFTAQELVRYCGALAAAGFAGAFAAGWLWPRARLESARFFDRVYDLKERTSTALEIAAGRLDAPDALAKRQLADAVSAVRRVDTSEGLPIHVPRPQWLLALVLLAATAAALALPNPQEARIAQDRAVEAAIQETAQQIEAIRQATADNPNLTAEEREELTQPLEEAQRQLEEGDLTREQAVAILTQAENELQQLVSPEAQAEIQALQNAGEGLTNDAITQQLGENLAEGDLQSASQDLASLDTSNLSQSEQAALAQELQQAAESLETTNPELASELREASTALENGDMQAAEQALENASETLASSASELAQAQAAEAAAGQVAQGQQSVAGAGQESAQQGQGQQGQQGQGQQGQGGSEGEGQQGEGEGQGEGDGQGQGQGQGQGSGEQQGQGDGGGGSGRGESGGEAQGGETGQGATGDNGAGDGGERGYEPIYAPVRLGGEGGPEVDLPGTGDPGDEVIGQGDTNPQETGEVTVPYNEVFGDYNEAAHDAIRSGDVPIGLRPVVRDYFSSLEP